MGKTFANVERRGGVSAIGFGDPFGLAQLATSYIRLAIAHKACEESLAMTNRHVLEGTIRSLEAAEIASPIAPKSSSAAASPSPTAAPSAGPAHARTSKPSGTSSPPSPSSSSSCIRSRWSRRIRPASARCSTASSPSSRRAPARSARLTELGVEDAYELCDYNAEAQAMSSRRTS